MQQHPARRNRHPTSGVGKLALVTLTGGSLKPGLGLPQHCTGPCPPKVLPRQQGLGMWVGVESIQT